MSNQAILWGTLIGPWLTLIFMPREDLKRYFAAGLLGGFLSILVSEVGVAKGWWYFKETTYPLAMMSSYTYGLFPVLPMWILKYTFGRFWLYCTVEVILNTVFATLILPWFSSRGFLDFKAGLISFILASILALIIYGFQTWQEGIFANSEKTSVSPDLQPAVAKPLPQKQEQPEDKNETPDN